MTTAHRATYKAAVGNEHQGGYRYYAPRSNYSVRDLKAQSKLKLRQGAAQGAPDALEVRDLRAELEAKERRHYDRVKSDKRRQGLIPYAAGDGGDNDDEDDGGGSASSSSSSSSSSTSASSSAAGAAAAAATAAVDWSKFDDSDDSGGSGDSDSDVVGQQNDGDDSSDDSDDDSSDGDDEAALMRELEKIRAERERVRVHKQAVEQAEQEAQRTDSVMTSNPLLNAASASGSFGAKRRWNDDVVFKNQAREEKRPKRFINDSIRSDFHRSFMNKYCR